MGRRVPLAKTSEVKPGALLRVEAGGEQLVVAQVDGQFCALQDECPHGYAQLSDGYLENGRIECPLHGGVFDAWTGACLEGPPPEDARTYPLVVVNGVIFWDQE